MKTDKRETLSHIHDQRGKSSYGKPKKMGLMQLVQAIKERRHRDFFSKFKKDYPQIANDLMVDLLQVENYSEIEISYCSQIPLDVVRQILQGDTTAVSRRYLLALINFYGRVFCGHVPQEDELITKEI